MLVFVAKIEMLGVWAQLANGTTVLLNHAGYASMAAMYARWLLREARLSGPDARNDPEMLTRVDNMVTRVRVVS